MQVNTFPFAVLTSRLSAEPLQLPITGLESATHA